MIKLSCLLIPLLILLCPAEAAHAQDVGALAEKLEAAVKEGAPCWELVHRQEREGDDGSAVELNWVGGEEAVMVYIYHGTSVEAAADLFQRMRTAPVASPGQVVDSYKFGDESKVTSYHPYSRSSYIFFRSGRVVVRIDSSTTGEATSARTLENAVSFARLTVEQITAR
jgi:hypothetical protein